MWVANFMRRSNMHRSKGTRQAGHFDSQRVYMARRSIQRSVCTSPNGCISNTDEVAVLYRSFPSRAIRNIDKPATYSRLKERLTAVLTVFVDGRKAPLTIIGKSRRPKSFPRHFDAAKDLGIFYKSQKNAWNTQQLWTSIVTVLNNATRLQHKNVISVVDNCSAHAIDYTRHENWSTVFLPPNMTSVLQSVDAPVGRSFKSSFRRLLVDHILTYVDKQMKMPEEQRSTFKLTQIVTTYDAVVMMMKAWDMVPISVVLNSWLTTGIVAPYQREDILQRKTAVGNRSEPAMKAIGSSATSTESAINASEALRAKAKGEEWLKEEENDSDNGIENHNKSLGYCEWTGINMHLFMSDWQELARLNVVESFSDGDLQEFSRMEDGLDICVPVSSDNLLYEAVSTAMEEVREPTEQSDSDSGADAQKEEERCEAQKPSLNRLQAAAVALRKEANLFAQSEHPFSKSMRVDFLARLDIEIENIVGYRKRSRRQSTVDSFFPSSSRE